LGQVGRYYYPDDVWIDISDPGHIWIKIIGKDKVKMGIDDFAAKNNEEIISIRLQKKGKESLMVRDGLLYLKQKILKKSLIMTKIW